MAKKSNRGEKPAPDKKSLLNRSLYSAAQKIMALADTNYTHRQELSVKNDEFQKVINRELDLANGVSHGSIIDFIQAQRESTPKKTVDNTKLSVPSENIFTENIDQIYAYLTDLYANKYGEINDLKYICKFIPVLGQAIKTSLNHVCTADAVAESINRIIDFDIPVEEDIKRIIISEYEKIETNLKLQKKLKRITFRGALTVGSSYIYRISYDDLFGKYMEKKEKERRKSSGNNGAPFNMQTSANISTESVGETFIDPNCDIAIESITKIIESIPNEEFSSSKKKGNLIRETTDTVREIFDSFHIIDNDILQEAYEQADCYYGIMNNPSMSSSIMKPSMEASSTAQIPDGAVDPKTTKDKPLFNSSGSYVKFIEAGDMVPLKVFEEIVGYYHIVSKKKRKSKVSRSFQNGLFASSAELSAQKKEKAMDSIVESISNMIIQRFNQKFLEQNMDFKKLIGDCILAKGIADNEYSIQFIPAKYVYAFHINESIDGEGESILTDSMFPGKILLSYLVSKLLLFVNNSGDKTIVTTHQGPIDLNTKNHVDRVVRDLEGQSISFGDFLTPNIMFNKFNRNANIVVPTSLNGTKLLEFEKLEGKQLDMQTDMEEKFEKMALIGSGVPDTIMEYVNDLQFSRQIVSSSIKYAGDVSSLQSDLEGPTTSLYRDLGLDSTMPEEAKRYIPHLFIRLPRPKVISNTNNNDNVRIGKEIAEMIAEIFYGQEPKSEDITAKQQFILEVCKDIMEYIDWNKYEQIKEKVDVRFHGPGDVNNDNAGSETY